MDPNLCPKSLEWKLISAPRRRFPKVPILTDSQVTYYMFMKRRSGVPRLWWICQRFGALCLATNITADPIWICTNISPAYEPSS